MNYRRNKKITDRHGVKHSIVIDEETDLMPKMYSMYDIPPRHQEYVAGLTHSRYWIDNIEVTEAEFYDLFPQFKPDRKLK